MSRVIAAYDLDEDHGRVLVNADLECMPDIVIVANQQMDRAQTVTYVPETRLLEAMDAAREAERRADMAEMVAADHKRLSDSLKETNDDLRRIIDELRETEGPADENDKLRELVKDMVLNIGGCALHGNPLRLREFGSRAKELGIEVDE